MNNWPQVKALHHVSLVVKDTQRSIAFYCDLLGFELTSRPELSFPGAWLQVGGQQIHLLEVDNADPVEGRPQHGGRDRHVAVTVVSLEPVKHVLSDAGIDFSLSKSGRAALFCRDPDGNALEVIEVHE